MDLSTDRLKLRRFNRNDLDLMVQLESDPEVMKFTPLRKPIGRDQSMQRLENRLLKQSEWEPLGVWAVEQKADNDFVGWFMLLNTTHPWPELGFMLVRRHWGKGYATEAARKLMQYGFETVQLPGLYAVTDPDNLASKAILKKLGFQLTKNQHPLCIFQIENSKLSSK